MKGGDEKVEEVRFGLLSFKKEVEGLRAKVVDRKHEIEVLIGQRKRVLKQVQLGRRLLEVGQRIEDLEERLMLASNGSRKPHMNGEDAEESESDVESEDEDEDEDETDGIPISRLQRHMEQYMYIRQSIAKIGDEHPFLMKHEERVSRLRQTVLLDLDNGLKQAAAGGEQDRDDLLKLLELYKQMGEENEAISVLKESKLGQRQSK